MQPAADSGSRTIYLLRHAQPAMAPGGKRYIGWSDPPLSPLGIDQARRWRPFFSTMHLAAAFCSDLQRSRQTAENIISANDLPISALPELREINLGAWEGRTFESVRRQHPRDFEQRGRDPEHFRPPGGESFGDLLQRVSPVFDRIIAGTPGHILIVGHAGVNRVILCHLLGMPPTHLFRIDQDYAALNIIIADNAMFRLRTLNCRIPAASKI